jgi:hypothetical protein
VPPTNRFNIVISTLKKEFIIMLTDIHYQAHTAVPWYLWGTVSGPPPIPKSTDAQVPSIMPQNLYNAQADFKLSLK